MEPKKIGRYEIRAELGRGGMATVYKAYDPMFEREVALKVLPPELLHDEQFRERFEREAKTIAKLEHAAIVPVYDVGQHKGQPYFVMRYMTGGSLTDRMQAQPVSLGETARIVQRIAAALDYAHSKGIIHRDLKPGNILFDETGDPFISDYGIAKLSHSQTNLTGSTIIGTPTYMSPEQAQGEDIDSRSDIYSLGVIVYEMLSGRPPYEANTPLGVVFKHVSEPIPHILDINPSLPDGAEAVIEKAMAKKPADRFATAIDLASALAALARGETPDLDPTVPNATHPASAKKQPAPAATTGSSNSLRWVLGGVAVLIIAAVVLGGIGLAAQITRAGATPTALPATATTVSSKEDVGPQNPPPPGPGGGTDKIALTAENDIWMMNLDGSEALQLTRDAKPKFDLQWLPDGSQLLYVQNNCAFSLDPPSQKITRMVCFNDAQFFQGFRVSPDGKQVAISLNRRLYVVPFDPQTLAAVHDTGGLLALKGCIIYTAVSAKSAAWSRDGQKLAVMYSLGRDDGRLADTVRVLDIHNCRTAPPLVVDEFPSGKTIPEGYLDNLTLPSLSWDGDSLFLFNTLKRNEGFGQLYTYDLSNGQENKINPIQGACCYRDARFSPDGRFILFAFQDFSKGADSTTVVYYIPFDQVHPGAVFEPIKLPPNLFTNPREKPQFALRPIRP